MNRLTVCVIVRDEAERLPVCLESVRGLWDQLVVVDTGSTDDTVKIARAFGAEMHRFEWTGDFAAARNFAESVATSEYILWIDGDETLADGHDAIREIVAAGTVDAVRPVCRNAVDQDGAHLRQELLRKRGRGEWRGKVHEYLTCPLGTPEPRIVYQHHDRTQPREKSLDERFTALWAQIAEDGPSCRTYGYLAKEHAIHGNWAEAVALISRALEEPDGSEVERSELAIIAGNAYGKLGQHARARGQYLRAMGEWDGWAEPYFAMGVSYVESGRPAHAIPWINASMAFGFDGHAPFGESIYRWRRHAVMGAAYGNLGQYDSARIYLREALQMCPGNSELERQLAFCEDRLVPA